MHATSPPTHHTFLHQSSCLCRQARKLFRKAIILGVHRAKVGVLAVPADELLLQAGDELFGLAYNGAEFKVTGANVAVRY